MDRKINETDLVVLRKTENGKVYIDYFPIENPYRNELSNLYGLCKNEFSTLNEIEGYIKLNQNLLEMRKSMDFCRSLSSFNQNFLYKEAENFEIYFKWENNKILFINEEKENIKSKKARIIYEFEHYDLPFAIECTYEKCRQDESILVFSQRRVGWSFPAFKLTNDFVIEFATNFGYGSASYFYTQLTFKDIGIFPFSDWVMYKEFHDIIRYSKKPYVRNDSWYAALKYGEDAINLYIDDENQFITHYILDECDRMVTGLESILNNNIFAFKQPSGDFANYTFENKRVLLEFRGEKITGALTFINSISNYDKILNVSSFINKIEDLNKSIHPILIKELNAVSFELESNHQAKLQIEPTYITFKNEYDYYIELKRRIKRRFERKENDLGIENKSNLELCFGNKYPLFIELENSYKKLSVEYQEIVSLIHQLESLKIHFEKHIKNIKDYFESKSNEVNI
jgi:hypothetical protein